MPGDVIVAGHVCLDIVPVLSGVPSVIPGSLTDVGMMKIRVGGCVGNVARDLTELDLPVRLAAALGDDDLAPVLLAALARHGLPVSQLQRLVGTGTSYSVVVEPHGLDRAFWHHVGANAFFDGADMDFAGADVLHLGYVTLLPRMYADGGERGLRLLRAAKAAGVTTSVDTAVVDPRSAAATIHWPALLGRWLPEIDICTPSLDDLLSLGLAATGVSGAPGVLACARRLVAGGAGLALVTAGSAGMCLVTGSERRLAAAGAALAGRTRAWADHEVWCPAAEVEMRSTTGAGDAAAAGLICGLLRGASPADAVALAVSCAAQRVAGAARLDGRLQATSDNLQTRGKSSDAK